MASNLQHIQPGTNVYGIKDYAAPRRRIIPHERSAGGWQLLWNLNRGLGGILSGNWGRPVVEAVSYAPTFPQTPAMGIGQGLDAACTVTATVLPAYATPARPRLSAPAPDSARELR